jgi:hypothetical protein
MTRQALPMSDSFLEPLDELTRLADVLADAAGGKSHPRR